jgi:hypothetical protein
VVPPAEGLVGAGRIVINYQVVSATATTSSNLKYLLLLQTAVRTAQGKKNVLLLLNRRVNNRYVSIIESSS